ncbi:hypothetical protein HPB58_07115 [Priestia filamentosa]|uniref:hypothetical protein n=1 Tax=Priestia filamentosa TaxID=1402861 RepID=UPI001FB55229|nr:hypothetical protein [Priestia filamentosa]UOE61934.1 hypothetical protein HPB58_07115 [Priestia filamentosa]
MNKEGASVSYLAEALLFICRKTVKASVRQTQELTVEIKKSVKRGGLLLTKIIIRIERRGINPLTFSFFLFFSRNIVVVILCFSGNFKQEQKKNME